jgi:hypothetical protein
MTRDSGLFTQGVQMLDRAHAGLPGHLASPVSGGVPQPLYRDWHALCSLLGSRRLGLAIPWSQRIEHRRYDFKEDPMNLNAELEAEAAALYRTATRLQRVGLIVDRNALSPAHRRAAFALQCLTANCPADEESEPERALIGFAYPNAR